MQAQPVFHRLHRVVMACRWCAGALLGAGLMPPSAGGHLHKQVRANPFPKRQPFPRTFQPLAAVVPTNAWRLSRQMPRLSADSQNKH